MSVSVGFITKPQTIYRNTKKVTVSCSPSSMFVFRLIRIWPGKYLLEREKLIKENAWRLSDDVTVDWISVPRTQLELVHIWLRLMTVDSDELVSTSLKITNSSNSPPHDQDVSAPDAFDVIPYEVFSTFFFFESSYCKPAISTTGYQRKLEKIGLRFIWPWTT